MKKGFTLAEILITLAIIGIIAALTIPTIIMKYQEKVLTAKLKQTYSFLSQAYISALNEYGSPLGWELGGYLDAEGAANLTDKLVPYLQVQKNCRNIRDFYCLGNIIYKTLSGIEHGALSYTHYSKVKLKNGAVLIGQILSENCTSKYGDLENVCGAINIDLNGNSEPNTWGKDLHRFYITTDRIVPSGSRYFSENNNYSFEKACASNSGDIYGAQCTAWVIENGNMDYLYCPEKLGWNKAKSCKE